MGEFSYQIRERGDTGIDASGDIHGSYSGFTYDTEAWESDTTKATRDWFKEQAEMKGLDWREEYNRHIDRMRDQGPYPLRKIPLPKK